MKRALAIILTILSSITLLLLISFTIAERDHQTTTYMDEIECGTWRCPGYTVDYNERAALYTLSENELNSFWFLSLCFNSIGIIYAIKTKFGSTKSTLLDNLEKENEIIRKQIEKKELLVKLETLEKK